MKRIASDWTEMWETTFQAVSVGCGNMQYVVYKLRRYIIYDYFSLLFTLQSFIIISLFFCNMQLLCVFQLGCCCCCWYWCYICEFLYTYTLAFFIGEKKLNFIVIAFHSHNEIFSHRLSYSSVHCLLMFFSVCEIEVERGR